LTPVVYSVMSVWSPSNDAPSDSRRLRRRKRVFLLFSKLVNVYHAL